MATIDHQPFLVCSLKRENPSSKTLSFTFLLLSLSTLFFLTALFAFYSPSNTNRFHPSAHTSIPSSSLSITSNQSLAQLSQTSDADLLRALLGKSMFHIDTVVFRAKWAYRRINDPSQQLGLLDCIELMGLSQDRLEDLALETTSLSTSTQSTADLLHAWLVGVHTNYVTCLDGLEGAAWATLRAQIKTLMDLAVTSLSLINAISHEQVQGRRDGDLPLWLSMEDGMLVRATHKSVVADVVVAKDGSGNCTTIQEAIEMAPENRKKRYVIHVKKGTYEEKVTVGRKKKNVMMIGDGMDSTIVTGSLNVADGSTIFSSATFVALGDGFMAQDIWFQNKAGVEKHQAVALLVAADRSVIKRCRIDGYRNTLYAHSLRHFYRACLISGTDDFIFGNALAVFQNCKVTSQKAN